MRFNSDDKANLIEMQFVESSLSFDDEIDDTTRNWGDITHWPNIKYRLVEVADVKPTSLEVNSEEIVLTMSKHANCSSQEYSSVRRRCSM